MYFAFQHMFCLYHHSFDRLLSYSYCFSSSKEAFLLLTNRCFNRSEQIPQGASVKLPCSSVLKGQRLKIQLQYKGVLTLCEVKAFTPDQGDSSSIQYHYKQILEINSSIDLEMLGSNKFNYTKTYLSKRKQITVNENKFK